MFSKYFVKCIVERRPWYRLDTSANLYPSIINHRDTTLFRISIHLHQPIQADRLARALALLTPRFPYYMVQIEKGAFWYILVDNPRTPEPVIDSRSPCCYLPIKQRGVFPFRIRVFNRTVGVEFSHALTDGTGAVIFSKSLMAAYQLVDLDRDGSEFKTLREEFSLDPEILHFEDSVPKEEFEDAFLKHYDWRIPTPDSEKRVFHLPGRRLHLGHYRVLTGDMAVPEVLKLAKSSNASLTEYLTGIYFYALQEIQEQDQFKKNRWKWNPLAVMVPVNLRPILPSKTMRNFFLTLNPQLDTRLGHYELHEIVAKTHHYMRTQLDHRHLKQQIARNVKSAIHPLLRISPLWVKDLGLKGIYKDWGESRFSGSISNLGRVSFPESISKKVRSMEFVPPPSSSLGVKCGIVSYNDRLRITFGSVIEETALERLFFTNLRRSGVHIKLTGNWKDDQIQ